MILEMAGNIKVDGKKYNVFSSKHADTSRGSANKSRIQTLNFKKLKDVLKDVSLVNNEKNVIIWKYKDFYDGILIKVEDDKIIIITAIIGQKKTNPDKLFPKEQNRFIKQ